MPCRAECEAQNLWFRSAEPFAKSCDDVVDFFAQPVGIVSAVAAGIVEAVVAAGAGYKVGGSITVAVERGLQASCKRHRIVERPERIMDSVESIADKALAYIVGEARTQKGYGSLRLEPLQRTRLFDFGAEFHQNIW